MRLKPKGFIESSTLGAIKKVINAPPTASHKGWGGGGKGRRERGGFMKLMK
jgi:hypothetical protein